MIDISDRFLFREGLVGDTPGLPIKVLLDSDASRVFSFPDLVGDFALEDP